MPTQFSEKDLLLNMKKVSPPDLLLYQSSDHPYQPQHSPRLSGRKNLHPSQREVSQETQTPECFPLLLSDPSSVLPSAPEGSIGAAVSGTDLSERASNHGIASSPRTAPLSREISHTRVAGLSCDQKSPNSESAIVNVSEQNWNPEAEVFKMRDSSLVHGGKLHPDLDQDWVTVTEVHAHGDGPVSQAVLNWGKQSSNVSDKFLKCGRSSPGASQPFPLSLSSGVLESDLSAPAKPALRASSLKEVSISLPVGTFIDRGLPGTKVPLVAKKRFTADYFVSLHNLVAAAGVRPDGSCYQSFTPNFMGARIKLHHVGMKVERWRHHLFGYEHVDILQHIEYGFPLGLQDLPNLKSCSRNHGSAYAYFNHVDKFVSEEIKMGGLAGPFERAPWWDTVISPLMTAPKKPSSRRTVFDATFGDFSLNNATPSETYMGQPCIYTYPKIDDFRRLVLRCGAGSYMWKRDLSRFFLQIPLDPVEYHRVGLVWRGLFFFFIGLAFGLRHSGLQGQKITDALAWIHRRVGLERDEEKQYNVVNYSDDLGGCESSLSRATKSFDDLRVLMKDLGLEESSKKAEPPSTKMVYLGVLFDSKSMEMRVPPEKLAEIKSEIRIWSRKTTITKKGLQSLLGKLFWISRVVRYARVFMGRLLQQLRDMAKLGDNVRRSLSEETKKDLKWWDRYVEHFNGIQMIVDEDPFPLELSQMLDTPHKVCAGDATPGGGGAWHGGEYWCRQFPQNLQDPAFGIHLKEFWVLIVSAKLWGESWTGKPIILYCDNDAVVDTINHKKPKDSALLSLLREFIFITVTFKFFPVVRKIGTDDNYLADHISRRHDPKVAAEQFKKAGLERMTMVEVPDKFFNMTDAW